MAEKLLKTLDFGTGDTYHLAPEWDNIQNKPEDIGGGGTADSVEWDAVQNKPFTKVGGDTLTWDGNTEGLEVVGDGMFVKLSDSTPSMADLSNGFEYTLDADFVIAIAGNTETTDIIEIENGLMLAIRDEGTPVYVIAFDETTLDGIELTKGLYCINIGFALGAPELKTKSSLTINGYTGFAKETINPEVLPEALQFGETETGGDTLTWDGNTEGLYCAFDCYYKVSETVPTPEELANGGQVIVQNAGTFGFSSDSIATESDGTYAIIVEGVGAVMVCPTDGIEGIEKGLYFFNYDPTYTSSLTINGYTGFPLVKPLDEKYMPVLTSPSGKKFKITVDDNGTLTATEV